jgi:hypothetical protein
MFSLEDVVLYQFQLSNLMLVFPFLEKIQSPQVGVKEYMLNLVAYVRRGHL